MSESIKCEFYEVKRSYVCEIKFSYIPEDQELQISGQHKIDKSINDVNEIIFKKCQISKIPQGLTKIFPNLEKLVISYSNLKTITRFELYEYRNFKVFSFRSNQIEYLIDNLFADCKNLSVISFHDNKLKVVVPGILIGHENLKYVDFSLNINYTKCYSERRDSYNERGNATLEEVKQELKEVFEKFGNDRDFLMERSKGIKSYVDNFRDNFESLINRSKYLETKNQELNQILRANEIEKTRLRSQLENSIQRISVLEEKIKLQDKKFSQEIENLKEKYKEKCDQLRKVDNDFQTLNNFFLGDETTTKERMMKDQFH